MVPNGRMRPRLMSGRFWEREGQSVRPLVGRLATDSPNAFDQTRPFTDEGEMTVSVIVLRFSGAA